MTQLIKEGGRCEQTVGADRDWMISTDYEEEARIGPSFLNITKRSQIVYIEYCEGGLVQQRYNVEYIETMGNLSMVAELDMIRIC